MRATLMGIIAIAVALPPDGTFAGEANVEAVEVRRSTDGAWDFVVTIRHSDEGWEHYANAFTIQGADGTVFGTRTLYHPHVDEQPFTRSLRGVTVPDGISMVRVRAHDSVHGPGPAASVRLPNP